MMDKRDLSRPALTNEREIGDNEITQSQTLGTDKEQEIRTRNSVAAANETAQQKCMDIQSDITNIVTMVSESFKKFQTTLQQMKEKNEKLSVNSMPLHNFIRSRNRTSDSTFSSTLETDTVTPSQISLPSTSENVRISSTSNAPSVRRSTIIEHDYSTSFGVPAKKAKTTLTHSSYDYGSIDGSAPNSAGHNEKFIGPFSSLIKKKFLSDVLKEDDDYDIYNDDYHWIDKGVEILHKEDFGKNKTEPYASRDATDNSRFSRKRRKKRMIQDIQFFFKNNPVKVDENMSTSERMNRIKSSKFFSDEFAQTSILPLCRNFTNKETMNPEGLAMEVEETSLRETQLCLMLIQCEVGEKDFIDYVNYRIDSKSTVELDLHRTLAEIEDEYGLDMIIKLYNTLLSKGTTLQAYFISQLAIRDQSQDD